jgi:outer membrane lipopolysaccharide assembly protein LptE/RlpB
MTTTLNANHSNPEWQILVKRGDEEKELLRALMPEKAADAMVNNLRSVYGRSAEIIKKEIK